VTERDKPAALVYRTVHRPGQRVTDSSEKAYHLMISSHKTPPVKGVVDPGVSHTAERIRIEPLRFIIKMGSDHCPKCSDCLLTWTAGRPDPLAAVLSIKANFRPELCQQESKYN